MLAERAIGIDAGVDPALLAAERGAEDTQRRLAYRWERSGLVATAPAQARLQREIGNANREVDALRGRIRAASPRYADIAHPVPLRVADIRSGLLDADTLILEYWLGDSKSYLWVVAADGVRSHELPPRSVIAKESIALRERVTARARDDASVSIERRIALDAAQENETAHAATALAGLILPRTLRTQPAHQWAIVADAELHDIPFALLVAEAPDHAAPALVQLPSIGALRGLRALPQAPSGTDALAIVADPVFARADPRLRDSHGSAPVAQPQAAASEAGIADLPLLPQARAEADAIGVLAAGRVSAILLGFDANRDAVLQRNWSGDAIVHFATHALVDARHPELSGIVLSLYDRDGAGRDGFLRVNDVYALQMPVDLVVLGVCDSAQGRQLNGEGVLSLARAFFHAGTRHVLASLWPVDDRASAVFMHAFYGALLQERLRPQQALARAQQEMRADPRWKAAYYWSGFVVQGDWR
jgi:CHAT domain-containing protein